MSEENIVVFSVRSGYGHNTRLPYVEVRAGDFEIQMPPNEARALALNLLSAAEAALSDAFFFEFTTKILKGDEQAAATMLYEWRERRKDKDELPGSVAIEDD